MRTKMYQLDFISCVEGGAIIIEHPVNSLFGVRVLGGALYPSFKSKQDELSTTYILVTYNKKIICSNHKTSDIEFDDSMFLRKLKSMYVR